MLYPEREYIQSVRGPSLSEARRVSSREGLSSRREPSTVFLVVLAPLPPRLHSWGSQLDLAEGMQTGESLSSSSPAISTASSGIGSPFCGLFPSGSGLGASPIFLRADYSPLQSLQYEELLEVVTRSVCQVKHRLARRERLCFSGFSLAILLYWELLGRSSPSRVPAPHTGRFRNRGLPLVLPCNGTEVDDALKSRGLLRRGVVLTSTAQDCWGWPLLGKSVVHCITWCPSLLSALWRSFCQPCQSSRVQRCPESASLSSFCPES